MPRSAPLGVRLVLSGSGEPSALYCGFSVDVYANTRVPMGNANVRSPLPKGTVSDSQ